MVGERVVYAVYIIPCKPYLYIFRILNVNERIGEEVKWNGEEIWTNKFGGNRWKDSRVEKETDIGRIFERLCSFLERWRKAEEAVENRIYEEGNVKATNLFPYQCGIT